ncbi:MAG: hypothetical protein MUF58_02550 [Arcicella sp.]|nr:hypothetical protein [Arcicella sp.]
MHYPLLLLLVAVIGATETPKMFSIISVILIAFVGIMEAIKVKSKLDSSAIQFANCGNSLVWKFFNSSYS